MFNKLWLQSALVRALKTAAESALAVIGSGAMGVMDVDWPQVLSAAALGAIVSLLLSTAGLPEAGKPVIGE